MWSTGVLFPQPGVGMVLLFFFFVADFFFRARRHVWLAEAVALGAGGLAAVIVFAGIAEDAAPVTRVVFPAAAGVGVYRLLRWIMSQSGS
jgi:hypothetical protein